MSLIYGQALFGTLPLSSCAQSQTRLLTANSMVTSDGVFFECFVISVIPIPPSPNVGNIAG